MCTDGSLSRILPGIIISGGKLVGLKKMCPKNFIGFCGKVINYLPTDSIYIACKHKYI